jgi:hypothetical protein
MLGRSWGRVATGGNRVGGGPSVPLRRATPKEVELLRRLDEGSLAILPLAPSHPVPVTPDTSSAATTLPPQQSDSTGDQHADPAA